MNIERENRSSLQDVRSELNEKGYLVLEKGTQFELELEYASPEEEFIPFKEGESRIITPQEGNIVSCPSEDSESFKLDWDIHVGELVEFHRGKDGEKSLYKFTLANAKILYLEKRSKEFDRDIFEAFSGKYNLEQYYEIANPQSLYDVDMSRFAHDNPHAVEKLKEIEDPYIQDLTSERNRLNKSFVEYVLGDEAKTDNLESVRIVIRM